MRAGIDRDAAYGAVTPPIVLSSNFSFDGFGNKRQYDYTRSGNPTRDTLHAALAALEEGTTALAFASGLAAEDTLLRAALSPGDEVTIGLIPETLERTTLGTRSVGEGVDLEVDVLAKYVEKLTAGLLPARAPEAVTGTEQGR